MAALARRSPTNYILVIGFMVAPVVALISLRGDLGSAPFLLTAVGVVLTLVGAFGMSRFLAEPNYEVILRWNADQPPGELLTARHRYFALNWARGALTWAAFVCFLAATYADWR
jgi:hypothetical protein